MRLEDKVALVTGAARGIGEAIARAFAAEGAFVFVSDIDEVNGQAVANSLGHSAVFIRLDVRSETAWRETTEAIIQKHGKLDILVNNAAHQAWVEDIEQISDAEWHKTLDTNLSATFWLSRAALRHMGRGASIINTTSINSFIGHPLLVDYTSTKGAIDGFTRALSQQLIEREIRVNQIAPGPIWTPLQPPSLGKHDPQMLEDFGSQMPMGRCGQPCELGPAYVYLACEDSSYVSGQTIHINGGKVVNG